MARTPRRPMAVPTLVFAGLTVVVWGTRIRNIADDDSLSNAALIVRVTLAVGMLVLGAAAFLTALRPGERARKALWALAGATVVMWGFRGITIALGDHSTGFKVVHTVLAVASIGLAGWAVLADRKAARAVSRAE